MNANQLRQEIDELKVQAYNVSRELNQLNTLLQQTNNAIAQKEFELHQLESSLKSDPVDEVVPYDTAVA